MPSYRSSIDIEAPIETVFSWIDDPAKAKKRISGLEHTRFISGEPTEVGAKFVQKIREGGHLVDYDGEILVYDRPNRYSMVLHNPEFNMAVDYRLEARDEVTHVDFAFDLRPTTWVSRVMSAVVGWFTNPLMREQLERFKELAEAEAKEG